MKKYTIPLISLLLAVPLAIWLWRIADAAPYKAFANGQHDLAEAQLLPRAEKGDPRAQHYLGHIAYARRDIPQAISWWEKAAAGGESDALLYLADRHFADDGVPQDAARGQALLEQALAAGNRHAAYALYLRAQPGQALHRATENHDALARQSMQWLAQGVQLGDQPSLQALAYHQACTGDTALDIEPLLPTLGKALRESSAPQAAYLLGLHQQRLGNTAFARDLFLTSLAPDFPHAAQILGEMAESDDPVAARENYYPKAASQDACRAGVRATYRLALMEAQGRGGERAGEPAAQRLTALQSWADYRPPGSNSAWITSADIDTLREAIQETP